MPHNLLISVLILRLDGGFGPNRGFHGRRGDQRPSPLMFSVDSLESLAYTGGFLKPVIMIGENGMSDQNFLNTVRKRRIWIS
jgi:hypothetical protein